MIRPNASKMANGCGEEASAQKNQNWGYDEAKCLVETWADDELQRQLSVIGRKQNSWENITEKLNNNGSKRTTSQCKTQFTR